MPSSFSRLFTLLLPPSSFLSFSLFLSLSFSLRYMIFPTLCSFSRSFFFTACFFSYYVFLVLFVIATLLSCHFPHLFLFLLFASLLLFWQSLLLLLLSFPHFSSSFPHFSSSFPRRRESRPKTT